MNDLQLQTSRRVNDSIWNHAYAVGGVFRDVVGRRSHAGNRPYAPLRPFSAFAEKEKEAKKEKTRMMNRTLTVFFLLLMAFACACAMCSCATGNSPISQAIADKLASKVAIQQSEIAPSEGFKAFYAR